MKEFLNNLWCALIVFIAYQRLGYYNLANVYSALNSYFVEKRRLGSDVLMVKRWGVPIGTLMCSVDRGELPVDTAFPESMRQIRELHEGHLAYFGKFAVIPLLRGRMAGKKLLEEAITSWSLTRGVNTVVMMVNPKHVSWYKGLGAVEIERTNGTKGLEKAPAVLLVLEYEKSPTICAYQKRYIDSVCTDHKVNPVVSCGIPA